MKQTIFKGTATALVTPFKENGEVDFESFKKLIDMQIKAGINALVFLGTTGEASTLSQTECDEVIKFAVNFVDGRTKVIAGAGSNNTSIAIEKSKRYEQLGVDGLLHVTPYYNKATQSGLFEHYKAIADSTTLPIILYNVPGRTGTNISAQTVYELSKISNIVAIKEASGDIEKVMDIKRLCEDDFGVYSGEDNLTYSILSLGGIGVISVVSNVIPQLMLKLTNSFFEKDYEMSLKTQLMLTPLIKSLFSEVNPIPAKTALGLMGVISPTLRLPLTPMQEKTKEVLKQRLKELELI